MAVGWVGILRRAIEEGDSQCEAARQRGSEVPMLFDGTFTVVGRQVGTSEIHFQYIHQQVL